MLNQQVYDLLKGLIETFENDEMELYTKSLEKKRLSVLKFAKKHVKRLNELIDMVSLDNPSDLPVKDEYHRILTQAIVIQMSIISDMKSECRTWVSDEDLRKQAVALLEK